MSNLAIDQIERARTYVVERNIDIAAARPAFISQYPQLARAPRESIDFTIIGTIGIWLNVRAPWTTDSVAEQLANQSGAFPWNGPVGNGSQLRVSEPVPRDGPRAPVHVAAARTHH
ncbi:hypothetical protein GS966_28880 [Rhodococcus hoagii]|nr:hypothetical protein [Prescottella equi]